MTVQFSDSQDSSKIYNRTTEISGGWAPYDGGVRLAGRIRYGMGMWGDPG